MPETRKIIIFDFNRTLYDPERRQLLPDVEAILQELIDRHYRLYLVSTANPSRAELIESLGLKKYFTQVFIVQNKKKAFDEIEKSGGIDFAESFVVGDRVRSEIVYGNDSGMNTVWLRSGRFSGEMPSLREEVPKHTITYLAEILHIIN